MSSNIEDPPVYSPVSTTEDPKEENDSPPSYSDLMGRLRAAKEDSKSPIDLTTKTVNILCSSVFFTIFLAISAFIPVAMLVIGLMSREKCPINSYIPLWLIVSGISGTFLALMRFFSNVIVCLKSRKSGETKEPTLLSCFINLATLFGFVWFIIGNVWVYGIVKTVQYDNLLYPNHYCDKLCYLFSFWSITATWILIALAYACCCACICCVVGSASIFAACLKKDDS